MSIAFIIKFWRSWKQSFLYMAKIRWYDAGDIKLLYITSRSWQVIL